MQSAVRLQTNQSLLSFKVNIRTYDSSGSSFFYLHGDLSISNWVTDFRTVGRRKVDVYCHRLCRASCLVTRVWTLLFHLLLMQAAGGSCDTTLLSDELGMNTGCNYLAIMIHLKAETLTRLSRKRKVHLCIFFAFLHLIVSTVHVPLYKVAV